MDQENRGTLGPLDEPEASGEFHWVPRRDRVSTNDSKVPDSEVVARAIRRRFTAAYKLRILEEVDACSEVGGIGRILRREGIYSSSLAAWRQARDEGALAQLDRKRGRKPKKGNPLAKRVALLERENEHLRLQLKRAKTIVDVQRKVAGLLGFDPNTGKDC